MTPPEAVEDTTASDAADDDQKADGDAFDKVIAELESDRDSWKVRAEDAEKQVAEIRELADAAEARAETAESALAESKAEAAAEAAVDVPQTAAGEPIDDHADADKGGNAEAAKWRKRLRETEAERDSVQDMLTRTRQAQVDKALDDAGLDPRLLAAAGHTLDDLVGEDGLIDPAKLTDAIVTTAAEFRVTDNRPRRPAPNPLMGRGATSPVLKSGGQIWKETFTG